MELDPFTCRLGEGQGRVVATNGTTSFVLGDVEVGRRWELRAGDHVEVVQDLDVTAVAFVRATLSLRMPPTMPAGLAWEVSMLVDGAKRASFRCPAGRTKRSSELAANVSKLAGIHRIGVRLELVTG